MMFNLIDELFVPGRRHAEDERNRLELTREDEGSNDPARGPVDLAGGKVTIRLPRRSAEDSDSMTPEEPEGLEEPEEPEGLEELEEPGKDA
jgi:hypothetical protein